MTPELIQDVQEAYIHLELIHSDFWIKRAAGEDSPGRLLARQLARLADAQIEQVGDLVTDDVVVLKVAE